MTSTFAPVPLATCAPGVLDWSFNSRGQSPCVVASNVAGSCSFGRELSQLPPTWLYSGLRSEYGEAIPCLCNTVYYSLESACAACQGPDHGWSLWSLWSANCSTTSRNLPVDIPPSVAIPSWAYLNVVAGNTFNITLARANIGPDSVAPPGSTDSSTLPRSTTPSTLPKSTLLSTSSSQPSAPTSNQTNTGAIIGGVIGGIAVAIMLVGLSVYLLRRRSERSTASTFVSPLNTGTTLQPQVPMYDGSNPDGKHNAEPQVYHPPVKAPGGDDQMQYAAQRSLHSGLPMQYPGGPQSHTVIGQTHYKGVPETM
ncbi:hypothetical protein FA13DRAFT_555232 [Coprinellus micaceus]|uniref:Uncharacterized protein n=1 Tax=Coprinellus micaceus TaxID=71717 RepID=A0A4Y7T959_COPMI|nr:hypothetical protein FA13DRAFT_555232 [Coprinellus micaceus]